MRYLIIGLMCLMLAGCATTGNQIDLGKGQTNFPPSWLKGFHKWYVYIVWDVPNSLKPTWG